MRARMSTDRCEIGWDMKTSCNEPSSGDRVSLIVRRLGRQRPHRAPQVRLQSLGRPGGFRYPGHLCRCARRLVTCHPPR